MRACRNILGYDIFYATVFIAIFLAFGFAHLRINASSVSTNNSAILGNATPTSSAIVINNGSPITLTPGATTSVQVSFNVTDGNGCGEVLFNGSVTTTLFRQGAGEACTADNFNCYFGTVVHNCPSATTTQHTANATATFSVYYYAEATDASSSYGGEVWHAAVSLRDLANASSMASTTSGVELNSLLAISVPTTTIDYEEVSAGTNSGATNQESVVLNVGNASTTLNISGTGLTAGANVIPTSSQHYASSTFTFGGVEQLLSAAAQAVSGFWIAPFKREWSDTTSLPGTYVNHALVAYNNYFYITGGTAGTDTSTVLFAPVNASGSIGSWSSTTPLPDVFDDHPSVAYNGYLYLVGGDSGTATSTVYFAPINATGSIGAWTQTSPLPERREAHPAFAYNGYMYVVGGSDGGPNNEVYFAPINATGSIGSWSSTTPLLISTEDNVAFTYNGYIYTAGGLVPGNSLTSTVLFASINATGSVGSWATSTALPSALYRSSAVVHNGYVYLAGGENALNANRTSTVLFASFNATGSLGSWNLAPPLPTSSSRHAAVAYNGYHYLTGGQGGSTTSTVKYNSLFSRNLYWGIEVPSDQPGGTYTGTITYTAVYSP